MELCNSAAHNRIMMKPLSRSLSRHHDSCYRKAARNIIVRWRVSLCPKIAEARQQQAENVQWSRQPLLAVLEQPPFDVEGDGEGGVIAAAVALNSLDNYLQARRWQHPGGPARRFLSHLLTYPLTLASGLRESGLDRSPAPVSATGVVQDAAASYRTTGSTVSGSGDKSGRRASTTTGSNTTSSLAVVCLGARAESTMPPALWREALFALPSVSHLSLHLIGPELAVPPGVAKQQQRRRPSSPPPRPSPATASRDIEEDDDNTSRRGDSNPSSTARYTHVVSIGARTLEIGWTRAALGRTPGARVEGEAEPKAVGVVVSGMGRATAAEPAQPPPAAAVTPAPSQPGQPPQPAAPAAPEGEAENVAAAAAAEEAIANADAFVLFNPGLGHPHLREGWAAALKRLLATGKPIVVSCHSRRDLERDARLLRDEGATSAAVSDMAGRDLPLGARKNAFRSLMASEDPLSAPGAEELVAPNWGVFVVRGGGAGRGKGGAGDHSRACSC